MIRSPRFSLARPSFSALVYGGAVVLAALSLVECLGDPTHPSRSPNDPANPHAREAPMLALGPDGHQALVADDAGAVYTCPMHPEVERDAPGSCPKCGMTLVRKAKP